MSKSSFLLNLRTARNLFVHKVQTDHPGLDPESVEGQLARAAIWLGPNSVKGFDKKDFPELAEHVRDALEDNVNRFLQIAKQAPADAPVTAQQTQEAMQCFIQIVKTLEPYLQSGGETQQIREALEAITFPDAVLTWDFELGADSTGDPAVWVWVFVGTDTARGDNFSQLTTEIQELVRETLSRVGVARWPYVRFRTASEQRSLSD